MTDFKEWIRKWNLHNSRDKKRLAVFLLLTAAVVIYLVVTERNSAITAIVRPEQGSMEYVLIARYGEETESFSYVVEDRELTLEEITALRPAIEERLLEELLGENEDVAHIRDPVNLVTSLSDYEVKIYWQIENADLISYLGKVACVNEPEQTSLTATVVYTGDSCLSKEELTWETTFVMTVLPPKVTVRSDSEEILYAIEEADRLARYEGSYDLPETYRGETLAFWTPPNSARWLALLFIPLFPLLLYFHDKSEREETEHRRKESMNRDYPDILMKLSLLIGAGMTPINAFGRITEDYRNRGGEARPAYEQLCDMLLSIRDGTSETEAYAGFGLRFRLPNYIKLGMLLCQNLTHGNEHLRAMLAVEVAEALEERKAKARIRGEKAGTKLLFPMILLLGVVFVIILVPAFLSF